MSLGTRNVSNASHPLLTNSATPSAVRHWRSASSTPGTAPEIAARCAGCNATVEITFMDATNFRTASPELQGKIDRLEEYAPRAYIWRCSPIAGPVAEAR